MIVERHLWLTLVGTLAMAVAIALGTIYFEAVNKWRNPRFASDPGSVGRTVRLGTASATIVGVMPEGFGFPVNQRIWMPLRVSASRPAPRLARNPGVS